MNREDFEAQSPDVDRLRSAVREAFAPATRADQAAAGILAKLPSVPPSPTGRVGTSAHRALVSSGWHLIAAMLLLAIGLLAGFGLGRPRIAPAAPLPGKIDVRIASLEGTVLVRHASRQIWEPLSGGATLLLGDTVHAAGKSAVTLSLWDRSSIRLDANTTLSADAFGGRVEFALSSGTINADLQSAHTPFFIRTPQGTLEALGTAFVVSVD